MLRIRKLAILFRVDASAEIGLGHLVRCLTLADQLNKDGMVCHFLTRTVLGPLQSLIVNRGHTLHLLPEIAVSLAPESLKLESFKTIETLNYESWLVGGWARDAEESLEIIGRVKPDWLVVDHYGIDERWERTFRDVCDNVLIIDDMANRRHSCSLLLDQTFHRSVDDYQKLVSPGAKVLCGSKYALLRPQFSEARESSLLRRNPPKLDRLLITMGGMDKANITAEVLTALKKSNLSGSFEITVVMGHAAPWVEDVRNKAEAMPWPTSVVVGVENMALLMSEHDLGICAAGSTVWECCCLGLPVILIVAAENQKKSCENLASHNVVQMIASAEQVSSELMACIEFFSSDVKELSKCTDQMKLITAGLGAEIVAQKMLALCTDFKEGGDFE